MDPRCDHVGVLVHDLGRARRRLAGLGLVEGGIGEFPTEGTREQYLGAPDRPGRLLLLEPLGATGPYARALAARGPGLHHVAVRVDDPEVWSGAQQGWRLHPHSARSLPATAWLTRPGVGVLLEVLRATDEEVADGPSSATVDLVEVPGDDAWAIPRLGVTGTRLGAGRTGVVVVAGERFEAAALGA